ncbi:hypothetical protein [Nocardia puris]|uniref:Uncharacterized protein n=1 Tax=Nocardia puris TaxID=208602 RepID=A0A366E1R0_9NOCA|nr:hypothetical protein [Nocardia puris]RBO96300.1 hypothetical protein DFR74_101311 [Nocardia puris]
MRVNWQTYFDAGKRCHDLAIELRRADKPVHDSVKGECAGMAGNAPGCKQWGEAYDRYARDTLQTCTHLADALTNFGNVLYANGYKYAIADNARPQRPVLNQVSEYKVTIPTVVHDNGDGVKHNGGAEEFFSELTAKVLDNFEKLPNGDVDKLSKAADVWKKFANHETITGAPAKISAISALFDDMDAPENRAKIQEHFGTLKSGADLLASASSNIASPVAEYHSSTVEVGDAIKSAMNAFAWAVGLLVTGAIVGAIFSFGGSVVAAGGGVAIAVSDTIATIRGLYTTKRLFEILKLTLAATVTVGVIDAFGKVPDLTSSLANLAALIAMKVFIDDNSPTTIPVLGGDDPITKEIAKKIAEHANGRAQQGDGSHYVPGVGAAELPEYVRRVLDGEIKTEVKHLPRGRVAYWDPEKGSVVIEDGDGGTVFTPKEGREYFDDL